MTAHISVSNGLAANRTAGTVYGLLQGAAAASPEGPAVCDQDNWWSYSRLLQLSRAFSAWLAEQGVRAGDRVVAQLPNCREMAAILFGCAARGAIFVPINPGMRPFQLRTVLEDCAPRLAIVGEGKATETPERPGVRVCELDEVWSGLNCDMAMDWIDHGDSVSANDVAVLIYTSGSTAAPKAIVCPHARMVFAVTAINSMLGYTSGDLIFCRLPLSFDYGLYQILLACVARAGVVLSGGEPDVTILRRIRQTRATIVPAVPSLARMLIALAERDPAPTDVRLFTNTGAALPQTSIDALRKNFPGARVARMFGTTECKRISIMPPEAELERPTSVGLPLPGTDVVILSEAEEPLPAGHTGEIVVRGPHVMAGYWRAPEITARTFRRDATTGQVSLHTGDYGHLDDDGYLYFEGRRDDMFKHKGTRMSVLEIEAAAMDIPGIRAAAALPPGDGKELAICVATKLPARAVLRELAARLEPAKVPTACHVMDAIPLTLNGKSARAGLSALIRSESIQ